VGREAGAVEALQTEPGGDPQVAANQTLPFASTEASVTLLLAMLLF
jgi:hypothetical protein